MRILLIRHRPLEGGSDGDPYVTSDLVPGLLENGLEATLAVPRRRLGCGDRGFLERIGVACVEIPEDPVDKALLLPLRAFTALSREVSPLPSCTYSLGEASGGLREPSRPWEGTSTWSSGTPSTPLL